MQVCQNDAERLLEEGRHTTALRAGATAHEHALGISVKAIVTMSLHRNVNPFVQVTTHRHVMGTTQGQVRVTTAHKHVVGSL